MHARARAHARTAQRVLAAYPRWESVQLAQAARRVVLSIGAATLRSCSVLRGGRPVPAALTVLGAGPLKTTRRYLNHNNAGPN